MRRSNSSAGRGGRSSKPKGGFSKNSGPKRSRGGAKPFRSGSDNPDKKPFSERSGERPARFSKEGGSSEKGHFKRTSGKSTGKTNFTRGTGPKPEGFTRYSDKPERKTFSRDSERQTERKSSFPRRDDDRPKKFNREGGSTDRGNFKRPFDKTKEGGGTYLRRKEERPEKINGDSGESEKRNSYKPREESSTSSPREKRSPFRERPTIDKSGDFADRKKRKRIGGDERPFKRRDDKRSSGGTRSSSTSPGDSSPRSFGEKRFEKRPPKERKMGSFERRPKADATDKPWNRKEKHEFYGDRKKKAPEFLKTSEDGSVRLNKFIANAGICSRREADDLITAGVISVNGEVITELGYKVMPDDNVKYNNESLRGERLVYILLNKPKDFITTTDDPEDRKTVMSLIAKACKERVYPVGRLDRNTTGLLLFTNDGDLAKKLTHPSFQVHKVYQVELDKSLKTSDMEAISQGVTLEDGFIKPDEVVYAAEKNVIGIELHSGKNRIVRRIFEHLGYEVKKLDRVIFAGLTKKDLPRGRWRFLTDMEIASLKMITGKKSIK